MFRRLSSEHFAVECLVGTFYLYFFSETMIRILGYVMSSVVIVFESSEHLVICQMATIQYTVQVRGTGLDCGQIW